MDEADRIHLYETLLRGLADIAQDRMCAADQQHAWGPWRRFQVRHDEVPLRHDDSPSVAMNMVVRVRAERKCLNCGKEQLGQP